jgi:HD-like signal output (HDOD) protein
MTAAVWRFSPEMVEIIKHHHQPSSAKVARKDDLNNGNQIVEISQDEKRVEPYNESSINPLVATEGLIYTVSNPNNFNSSSSFSRSMGFTKYDEAPPL